jgi:ABC-type antimicrobial peptide transport system permease subunit
VPISWNWPGILGINIGVLAITWLVILIPVRVVNKINPSEAIRQG